MSDPILPLDVFEINENDPDYCTDREFEIAMWAQTNALMRVDQIAQQDSSLTTKAIIHTIMADYHWSDRLINEMMEQVRISNHLSKRLTHWVIKNGEWTHEC